MEEWLRRCKPVFIKKASAAMPGLRAKTTWRMTQYASALRAAA
jgi:hypothetical protein